MSVAPSDTKGCSFVGTDSYGYTDYFLVRGNQVMTWTSSTTYSGTQEQVFYIYVDKACTITATGETETDEYGTSTYQNVNLKLNKGWNAVTQKMTGTWNTESHTSNITISMTVGELSTCKWLIMY